MQKPSIFIATQNAERYQELLEDRLGRSIDITLANTQGEVVSNYGRQPVVLGRPDFLIPLLDTKPPVQWLQSTWAGVTPLAHHSFRDYQLTGVKGVFGQQMAEYVLTHLLAFESKLTARIQSQSSKLWDDSLSGTIQDKTIGIMGTGSIGTAVAQTCVQLGMRAIGFNTSGLQVAPFEKVFATDELTAFLEGCDYVVGILPDLEATTNLLDAAAFASMKDTALLINVGRGNLIDDNALLWALEQGEIAAAVLDVFKQEPLPATDSLWTASNLTITGHIAAVSRPDDIARLFAENYKRFASHQPLLHLINFDKGY
ncbi:MAG TPA: D-2-hydroxyacid dehydrogenase [Gammaproteobacteria bacterium]|nr:D-2-hydroxyacid dehydrogenase [Gammaproteobacteria bacterium]